MHGRIRLLQIAVPLMPRTQGGISGNQLLEIDNISPELPKSPADINANWNRAVDNCWWGLMHGTSAVQVISRRAGRCTKIYMQQVGSKAKGTTEHADRINSSKEESSHDYCFSKKH